MLEFDNKEVITPEFDLFFDEEHFYFCIKNFSQTEQDKFKQELTKFDIIHFIDNALCVDLSYKLFVFDLIDNLEFFNQPFVSFGFVFYDESEKLIDDEITFFNMNLNF